MEAAANAYVRAGDPAAAAAVAERAQLWELAANRWLDAREFGRAALQFERAGALESALEAARLAADGEAVARLLQALGRQAEAADTLARIGRWRDAALLYEAVEDFAKAGECFDGAESTVAAANAYSRAGDWGRAARRFQDAQLPADALSVIARMSQPVDALQLLGRHLSFDSRPRLAIAAGVSRTMASVLRNSLFRNAHWLRLKGKVQPAPDAKRDHRQ
jgi:tetratricopeptide (TPR) repeat protein